MKYTLVPKHAVRRIQLGIEVSEEASKLLFEVAQSKVERLDIQLGRNTSISSALFCGE